MGSWDEDRAIAKRQRQIRAEARRHYAERNADRPFRWSEFFEGWGVLLAWVIGIALVLFLIGALNAGTNTMPVTETMPASAFAADAAAA